MKRLGILTTATGAVVVAMAAALMFGIWIAQPEHRLNCIVRPVSASCIWLRARMAAHYCELLVAELAANVDSRTEVVTWRQGRCLPSGEGITFWALGELVKAHAGIYETDSSAVAEQKLEAVLPAVEERAWLRARLCHRGFPPTPSPARPSTG